MAHPLGKPMDTIRRPVTAASSFHQSATKHLQPLVTLAQRNGVSRRCLLTLLASAAAIPEASESRKALLQEYVKKSKENKEKNDKEVSLLMKEASFFCFWSLISMHSSLKLCSFYNYSLIRMLPILLLQLLYIYLSLFIFL